MIVILLLVGLVTIGKLWAYPKYSQHNPFSPAIRTSINVPIFYPQKLPPGYTVDPLSMTTTSNELIYNANDGSSRLVFTQQKIPAGFDFNTFYTKQLSNIRQLDATYGHIVIGKNDNRNLGSLVADKTWLLLTTNNQQTSVDDMSLVLKNLKQY